MLGQNTPIFKFADHTMKGYLREHSITEYAGEKKNTKHRQKIKDKHKQNRTIANSKCNSLT